MSRYVRTDLPLYAPGARLPSLHTVYPGRLMHPSYHYDFKDVAISDPWLAAAEFAENMQENARGALEEERFSMWQAGPRRIIPHAAVAPEQLVEDANYKVAVMGDVDQGDTGPFIEGFHAGRPRTLGPTTSDLPPLVVKPGSFSLSNMGRREFAIGLVVLAIVCAFLASRAETA